MAAAALETYQSSPDRLFWCKTLAIHKARTLTGVIAACHLWRQCQKKFIQEAFCKEIAHKPGATSVKMKWQARSRLIASNTALAVTAPSPGTTLICTQGGTA